MIWKMEIISAVVPVSARFVQALTMSLGALAAFGL
jgi:hypothetical protein